MRFFLILCAQIALLSVSALAAPLDQKLSYEQFQTLLMQKVSEIPELKPLWKASAAKHVNPYLMGGVFRGLLLWTYDNLQNKSVAQVGKMKPPSIAELLLQADSDRDLLGATDRDAEMIRKIPPYDTWDVLDRSFYRDSIADGGSGLDRVAASPREILDPMNGLQDFYHGTLSFRSAEVSHLYGNTPTALALRYLRFVKEFSRAAKPDPRSLKRVRELGLSAELPRNFHPSYRDRDSTRYWVKKALNKYFKAYGGDLAEGFVQLAKAGLLEPLSKKSYSVEELNLPSAEGEALIRELFKKGLSFQEIYWVSRVLCEHYPMNEALEFYQELASLARNDSERKLALTPQALESARALYPQDLRRADLSINGRKREGHYSSEVLDFPELKNAVRSVDPRDSVMEVNLDRLIYEFAKQIEDPYQLKAFQAVLKNYSPERKSIARLVDPETQYDVRERSRAEELVGDLCYRLKASLGVRDAEELDRFRKLNRSIEFQFDEESVTQVRTRFSAALTGQCLTGQLKALVR